jgi:OmpA-OmpF porin, OOP family
MIKFQRTLNIFEQMKRIHLLAIIIFAVNLSVTAQQKKKTEETFDINKVPISNAVLGTFPYFKTFPNFKPTNVGSDSITIAQNRTYFYDGKKFFTVDGKVSSQKLNLYSDDRISEFQMIQDFDRMVNVLGGKKIFTGTLPMKQLKPLAGTEDVITLCAANSLVQSAFYGVVEYVIRTPKKEIWIQFVPYTIGSRFYNLLIVEKQVELIATNTNSDNIFVSKLLKNEVAITSLSFKTDDAEILTQSREELLKIANIYQQHPDWKLKIEVHNAPLGKADYTLSLTQKRAAEIKKQLLLLGIKTTQLEVKGMGEIKPKVPNETEQSRIDNNRVEIYKM